MTNVPPPVVITTLVIRHSCLLLDPIQCLAHALLEIDRRAVAELLLGLGDRVVEVQREELDAGAGEERGLLGAPQAGHALDRPTTARASHSGTLLGRGQPR